MNKSLCPCALLVIVLSFTGNIHAQTVRDNTSTEHVFPQFVDGKFPDGTYFRSKLVVVSDSPTSANCAMYVQGFSLTTFSNATGIAFVIDKDIMILQSPGTEPFRSGYATLTCDVPVAAHVVYSSFSALGVLQSEATAFSSPAAPEFAQLTVDEREGGRLGFAIANTSAAPADFWVSLYNADFTFIDVVLVPVAAQSQVVKFLNELFPLPADFVGQAFISNPGGGGNVHAIGLNFKGNIFSVVPAVHRTINSFD